MNHGDDRKQILGRIARALATPAPRPGAHAAVPEHSPHGATAPAFTNQLPIVNNPPTFRQWMPPVGPSWDEQAALFAANSAELKAEFTLCDDEEELHTHLAALARECGWTRIASHRGDLTERATARLALPVLHTDDGYAVDELEACDAGISACEALVAQTGSVLVTNASSGGRALSVLPPHHVVLARRDQLVPDLSAALQALQRKYAAGYPSMISFITGPSRTGDIERILVLGAHGPKRLTIYCV